MVRTNCGFSMEYGTLRFSVDHTKLNAATERGPYSMPRMEARIDFFEKSDLFYSQSQR